MLEHLGENRFRSFEKSVSSLAFSESLSVFRIVSGPCFVREEESWHVKGKVYGHGMEHPWWSQKRSKHSVHASRS